MAIDKSKVLKSAEKFIAAGKTLQAIDEYLKILKENPKDWNLMIQVGDLYLKLHKTDEAIQYFQKVADHYYSDGFFLKAIAIYKRINKLDPNLTDICIKLADLYLKQGLSMDAKSQLQIVAQHYLARNQTKDAIQTFKRLIEIEPENVRTRNDLARAYKNEGMVPEAIKEYLEISDELTRKSLLKESLAVLETAYKLDPKNIDILQKILSIYSEQNETGKANALLEEALKVEPDNADLLGLRAQSLAAAGKFSEAHEVIDRAIVHSAHPEALQLMKGDLYIKSKDIEKAYLIYAAVVDRQMKRKEMDSAISLLQKITKADPGYYPALIKLIELYSSTRQETQLLSTYNAVVDAYIGKGMYQDAATYLEKLIKMEPENAQHLQKLDFVRSFFEKTKTDIRAPITEYEIEPAVQDRVSRDFDVPLNLESAVEPAISRVEPKPAPPAAKAKAVPKHAPAAPVSSPALHVPEEEKDFVSEHLIEAEVFSKYGLVDKAIEQLQIIISKYPNSLVAHQKLKEVFLEKGEKDRAVEECVMMSRIVRKQGDLDQAEDLLSEARQISPNHPSLDKAYKEMPVSSARHDVLSEIEKLAKSIKSRPGKPPAAKPEPAARAAVPPPPPPRAAVAPSPPPVPEPAPLSEPEIVAEDEIEIEFVTGDEDLLEAGSPAEVPKAEDFEEIDFYLDQGFVDEARSLLMKMQEKNPSDPSVQKRLSRLEGAQLEAEPDLPEREDEPVFLPSNEVEQEEVPIEFEDEILSQMEAPADLVSQPEVGFEDREDTEIVNFEEEEEAEGEMIPEISVIQEQPSIEETWDLGDLSELAKYSDNASDVDLPEEVEPGIPETPMLQMESDVELQSESEFQVESEPESESEAAVSADPPSTESFEDMGPIEFEELEDTSAALASVEQTAKPEPAFREPLEPLESVEIASQIESKEPQALSEAETFDDAVEAAFEQGLEKEEAPEPEAKTPEALFEEEEDFFDLAAELEEGFLNVQSAVEEKPADGQNYSLEEILTDFKKGVEKQLGSEDYDTRYNLGIAYKEMGLIDEAIAEFQIAAKDPKRFLECCSMLGLCFLEKGMPKLAIKWYQKGLDSHGFGDEGYQGLRYDLAQALEMTGELEGALEAYHEVYGMNAGYRNVSKKIKELEAQLKK